MARLQDSCRGGRSRAGTGELDLILLDAADTLERYGQPTEVARAVELVVSQQGLLQR